MNHKLNAQIAEFMGWQNVGCLQGGNVPFGERPDDYNKDHPANPIKDQVPDFSGSLDAAWEMECEIERRELRYDYARALAKILQDGHDYYVSTWRYIHATPEQRCEALVAIREETGGEHVQ